MYPALKQHFVDTPSGSKICCYTSDLGPSTPILTLIHGYPQSSYEWRYVVPELKEKVSLFIPELPGYGVSTPCPPHSKKVVGTALLEALSQVFETGSRKIILGGHDRGARICHRLAVDKDDYPHLNIVACALLDIVPTLEQWKAFANPAISSGYFHWPLLANVDLAVKMISAYGGAQWCRDAHTRIGGSNENGRRRMFADNAVEVYAELFDKHETLVASCEDYHQGAVPESAQQGKDQASGKKIEIPTLVMFSKAKLGKLTDVAKIWEDWVQPGKLKAIGVGDEHGHYLPEEAPSWVLKAFGDFLPSFQ